MCYYYSQRRDAFGPNGSTLETTATQFLKSIFYKIPAGNHTVIYKGQRRDDCGMKNVLRPQLMGSVHVERVCEPLWGRGVPAVQ